MDAADQAHAGQSVVSEAFIGEAAAKRVLDRRLDPFASSPLAVAFSGGSDSLATLILAKAWADRVGRKVFALTVNHGLNPSSTVWSADAAAADRLGVGWIGLSWTGDKPHAGLPAAARGARHRLLADAARGVGACVLLVGHTADDRAESELVRRETPGLGYLRDWGPSPAWPEGRDLFILRPLLHASRADLRTWVHAQGLTWLDDPGNADLRYARSRARAALAAQGVAGAGAIAPSRESDDTEMRAGLANFTATADGRLQLPRADLAKMGMETRRRLMGSALLCASGGATPPRGAALDRLSARLTDPASFIATLCGARIVAEADTIVFAREIGDSRRGGGVIVPIGLPAGRTIVFDGRFEVRADAAGLGVAPLAGRLSQLQPVTAQALRRFSAYARGALPALIDARGGVSLPAPFGDGPAQARSLVGPRLVRACGLIACEADIKA